MKQKAGILVIWFLVAGFTPLINALLYLTNHLLLTTSHNSRLPDFLDVPSILLFFFISAANLLWSFIPHFLFPGSFVWIDRGPSQEQGPRGLEGWLVGIVFYTVIILVPWIARLIYRLDKEDRLAHPVPLKQTDASDRSAETKQEKPDDSWPSSKY